MLKVGLGGFSLGLVLVYGLLGFALGWFRVDLGV